MWSNQPTYPMCVIQLYYCWLFSIHHRNFPCWWKVHVCHYVYISFVLPYYGCQYTPHPSLYVTPLQFHFLSKFLHINFLFGLTAPQQFTILVRKLSNNPGDEMMMSVYSLRPMFSILAAHPVTVTPSVTSCH